MANIVAVAFCPANSPVRPRSGIRCGAWLSAADPHGLCTSGIACKAIVDNVLDGDVSRVHSYGARFAGRGVPQGDAAGQHLERRRPTAGNDHRAQSGQCGLAVGCGVGAGVAEA
jgi:hypothetical protein